MKIGIGHFFQIYCLVNAYHSIIDYLKTFPEYAKSVFSQFNVRTNSTFDRVNWMESNYEFMPIGNADDRLMFVCETGYGDGRYDVIRKSHNGETVDVTITFIDEQEET